jgi:hypothetical protein
MISEEEFRNLTDDLQTVGAYCPTVRDMFIFVSEKKGLLRVDPENPKSWKGYAMVRSVPTKDFMKTIIGSFPEWGKFREAIEEIFKSTDDDKTSNYVEMAASEFGLNLQVVVTTFEAYFILTLPNDEIRKEFEKQKELLYS